MTEYLPFLKDFTPGAAGIWTLVVMGLLAWWKGLPAVIAAFTKRSVDLEARIQASMDIYITRTDKEIEALTEKVRRAEAAHKQCQREQDALREEMSGLKRQLAEYQIQIGHSLGKEPSDMVKQAALRVADIRSKRT